MPVWDQTRIAVTSRSALEARRQRTQEFARRAAQIHPAPGKDSYLHPEAALSVLLRDRAMNYGRSHGQVQLAPYSKKAGFRSP